MYEKELMKAIDAYNGMMVVESSAKSRGKSPNGYVIQSINGTFLSFKGDFHNGLSVDFVKGMESATVFESSKAAEGYIRGFEKIFANSKVMER